MMFHFANKREKRSPIGQRSLPQPGESLHRQLHDLWMDKIMYWIISALATGMIALFEWMHHLFNMPPHPWFMTIVFLCMLVFAIYRVWLVWPQLHRLRLGIQGERTVGQLLESLRGQGYRVFHDIEEAGYNIDHVLVGPGGVFSIETKTLSKPARGRSSITYDGQKVLVDGFELDRDPIAQAKAAARRVSEIIREMSGRTVKVQPVVLFPGWFVESPRDSEVIVNNENYFRTRLQDVSRRPALSTADVDFVSAQLDRYLRDKP